MMRRCPILPLVSMLLAVGVLVPATAHAARAGSNVPAPKSGQKLSVNIGTLPSSLDPGLARFAEDRIVANAIFAPLYRSPGGSSGKLVPHLAAGMPTITNGGRRYVVRLRRAHWSDGRPITGSDVVYAFNRARRASPFGAAFEQVQSARSIGSRSVAFTLSTPVPWFGELLASTVTTPVPRHTIGKYASKWTNLNRIVVSGPFKPTSGRGRSELVLTPNAKWWGARRVRIQELNLLAITHAAASPLFRANRLDVGLAGTSVHPSAIDSWTRRPDARFRSITTGEGEFLFLNTRSGSLASPLVRRAVALGIDRAALTDIVGKGVARPLMSLVPSGVRGSSSVAPAEDVLLWNDGQPRRVEAKELLAMAGWNPSTTLRLHYDPDTVFGTKVAESIAEDLLAVGMRVYLQAQTGASFAKVGVSISPVADSVDMVLLGRSAEFSDPFAIHDRFTCASIDSGVNPSNFCSTELDAAIEAARGASGAARLGAHRAIELSLSGSSGAFPAVPLYAPATTLLVQPWVRSFIQHPSSVVDFERIWVTRDRPGTPRT